MSRMRILVLFPLLILLATAALEGQVTGDIKGILADSSGAGVPHAKVVLTSQETGEAREQASDTEGRFTFNQLKIGSYSVRVEARGFRKVVAEATVRTGEIESLTIHLEVGQVTETVTVTDAATPLDVANSQIQVSVESQAAAVMPVGRNPILFALTAPGTVPVTSNNSFLNSGNYNSNGGRGRGNNLTVDNITSSDISVTGVAGGQLGPLNFDEIKEVKFISNNFSAEYGRNADSQLLFITKSGTNDFHGVAYEYLRNDKLNARDFFDQTGSPTVTRVNQFGYAVGGPIVRNKTHFFTSYEGFQRRGMGATRIARVPTPAMVAQVTDPTSRALLEQYKIPVSDSGQTPQSADNSNRTFQLSFRIDHQFSERDILTARYGHNQTEGRSAGNTFIQSNLANFGASFVNGPRNFNLAETHLFSPTVVNEFRFGFGRSSPYFAVDSTVPLGPRIQFGNGEVERFGEYEGFPQGRTQNSFEYSDTLAWVHGAHNFKLGADVYRYQLNSVADIAAHGQFQFDNWANFAAGKPSMFRQYFGSSVRGNRVTNHFYFLQDDWRVARSFTVNLGVRAEVAGGVSEVNGLISNLDIGCREPIGAAGSGPFGCFTLGQPSNSTNVNWAPRVGFAWSPGRDAKTVIRGGYGIAYDFLFLNPVTNQRVLPPYMQLATLTGSTLFTGENTWGSLVAGTSQAQRDAAASVGLINPLARNFGTVSPAVDPHLRNPQVQQWSFGIEREVVSTLVLKASYVGTKGNFLQRTHALNLINDPRVVPATSLADEMARLANYTAAVAAATGNAVRPSNRIDPRFNDVNLLDSSANSNYHSFQFMAQKEFRHGYSLQASYTVAKSIDDVSDALGVLINDTSGQQNPQNNRDNRAVSQFDLPQRLVVMHVWELPFGKNLRSSVLRRLAAGWGFAGITSFRSGFPVNFDAGPRLGIQPLTLTGVTGGPTRPNIAGDFAFNPQPAGSAGAPNGTASVNGQTLSAYAASLGFSQPLLGNYGNLGRNTRRLNGERNFDWNVFKDTPITERFTLQLRFEFYNIFNNTAFQDVNRTITSPTFGQYTTVTQDSRNVQIGARLLF